MIFFINHAHSDSFWLGASGILDLGTQEIYMAFRKVRDAIVRCSYTKRPPIAQGKPAQSLDAGDAGPG